MWNNIWQWAMDNYVFHAAVILAVLYLVLSGRIGKMLKRYKKVKAGPTGIELEAVDEDIDPNDPCPYTKSRDAIFSAVRGVNEKVDGLEKDVKEMLLVIKNMSIDQQKQLFYDANQPAAERLAGGLKYIHQGGNGRSKADIIAFAKEHKDVYNALTYVKPELRLIYD